MTKSIEEKIQDKLQFALSCQTNADRRLWSGDTVRQVAVATRRAQRVVGRETLQTARLALIWMVAGDDESEKEDWREMVLSGPESDPSTCDY